MKETTDIARSMEYNDVNIDFAKFQMFLAFTLEVTLDVFIMDESYEEVRQKAKEK